MRFVFSGYQATQRSEGAWANWGDVLWLDPLTPDEGAKLIAGPLARLGIDATDQAPAIAFRCGYQPAVLLRFGEVLLQRLESTVGYREGVAVTAEHVAETFRQPSLQHEIASVVRNNFDRNPFSRAVFYSLVLEFARLSPGQGLEDAADRVVECLQRPLFGAASEALFRDEDHRNQTLYRIAAELEDFRQRKLLSDQDRGGVKVYRLRFPHHLPVLLADNPEEHIRHALDELGQSDKPEDHSLIPLRVRDDLREIIRHRPEPGMEIRAVVVGSHWPEAVAHPGGGIPAQVGIDPVGQISFSGSDPRSLSREHLAVLGAGAADLDRVFGARPSRLPPPLLAGGASLLREALHRARGTGEFYELVGLGRFSLGVVRWWFQRVRGLNFPTLADLQKLYRLTGGIPLMVRELDQHLIDPHTGAGGVNIGPREVERAHAALMESVPQLARTLESGDDGWKLTDREVDLLRMVHVVCRVDNFATTTRVGEAITAPWWEELYGETFRLVYPSRPFPSPVSPGADEDALYTLTQLGLLPTQREGASILERLRPLPQDDALFALLKYLGATS